VCNAWKDFGVNSVMKQFSFILVVIISLMATGCRKNSRQNTSLYGTWELRGVQGGMSPYQTYAAGNGNTLSFSQSIYQKTQNNTIVQQGDYTIVNDNSVQQTVGLVEPGGQFQQRIQFNNLPNPKTFFQIEGNQLKLLSGFFPFDGGSYLVYEKISQ
jgi:hypothetical protein